MRVTVTLRIDTDGVGPVLFCHGTPRSDEEIITRATPAEHIASVLAEVGEATVVCGHTHRGSPAPVRLAGVIKPGRGLAVPRMIGSAMIERLETFGGCPIVPGTLNVRLPGPLTRGPGWRYLPAAEIGPEWSQETGQAGYFVVRVLIADRYRGLAFQADESAYPPDQVELVAGVNLRNVLGLGDGDAVSFSVVGWDP